MVMLLKLMKMLLHLSLNGGWISDLQLALSDRNALLTGKDLTEAIMNAAQMLLHHQFPQVKGLQDTGLSFSFIFNNEKECCSDISC